jgi:acetyl esterase/lipase
MTKNISEAAGEVDVRRDVVYATHDGVALSGDLYLPKGAGPFPALVAVHGGGWRLGARSSFQYWGPYLAARGYALYAISYRLAGKGRKTYPQAVNDVCAAVQFVRGEAPAFNLDPQRIALMGASAGAHLSALAALSGETFAKAYPQDKHAKASPQV